MNYDDTFEDLRRSRLSELIERTANDLKFYRRDYDPEVDIKKLPEEKKIAATTARVRLNDTLHELHAHLEEDWGVYDAERLYPTKSLASGDDTEDYANILGI
ncbi:MAG: hypothetical protein Unbinned767contig1000_12 [Prokaryotic dsDNA virus sp.]|nr:MAG: hypothetical protein Unbinned767contig1000_12 [Prokaryotic dsDNA virus sp.]|tara:strand:+ start:4273 stop:4578 length:306 start_codon:yes stop_codon:yes gene_type:complete